MAHFAVIAPPLRGHYRPLSNLAAELIERNHRVTFVHQEEARALVEADGVEFLAIGGDAPSVESWTRPMTRIRGLIGLGGMMKRMERFIVMFCSEAPRLLRDRKIDAIISDQLEPAGGLVAEHLRIPWVSVAATLPMNREDGVPPPFVPWPFDASAKGIRRNRGGWRVTDLLLRRVNRTIAANAAALGLPPRNRIEDCLSPYLQLAQLVPSLDFPRRQLPDTFHYVGILRRPAARAEFVLPPADGSSVFASLGTLQGSRVALFRKIAEASRRRGLRLILSHGGLAENQAMAGLPGDPLIYNWVPTEAVLDQVDFAVCHGGINSVLEPLVAGVPLVVMPLAFEQPGTAARVAFSGAGILLSRRTSAGWLADALRQLQENSSFRARAESIGAELRSAGGVTRAADLVERMLGIGARPAAATREHAARGGARDDIRNGSSSAGRRAS